MAQKTDLAISSEGYRLTVTTNGVTITSSDAAGAFYARETLKQLATVDGNGVRRLPLVEIEDAPRYRWRGVHFDDCRHFFGKETLLGVLDLMAEHKLNRLHWHLTDDQGWRLDVPGCPELVKYGAVRPESVRHGETEATNGQPYGAQCNNWSEYTWNEYDLAWKMWPRTCALAEVLWTGEARPGYADFRRRMAVHRARLIGRRVNCAPLE